MRRVLSLAFAVALLADAPPPVLALSTTVGGRKLDVDGELQVREVFEANRSTPHDRTQELLRVHLNADLTDNLQFKSTIRGVNGGPTFQATKAGTYNFSDTFQDVNPVVEFEEAYLDADLYPLEIRLGKQKLFWGKLDRFQPNDIFNPYEYQDPFLEDQEERKIGIPAAVIGYALPDRRWLPQEGRLTLAWAPMYVPNRFPEAGERWFPPAAVPPGVFRVPAGLIDIPGVGPVPELDIPIGFKTQNTAPPARRLENSSLGLRASGFAAGVDFALYYYHGIDTEPAFQLLADAFAMPDPSQPLGFSIRAGTRLEPVFRHVDQWGADAAYTWGPVTLRAEGAYIRGRPFVRDLRFLITDPSQLQGQIEQALAAFQMGIPEVPIDLGNSFVQRDAVNWGAGGDYTINGWFFLLQVNQTDVLHNNVDLLIKDIDTRLLLNLRKSFWRDRVHAQLIGTYAVESDYTMLLPRVTFDVTDNVDVRAGYLMIAGRRSSLIGQYKNNDEGFVRLRLSF